MDVHETRFSSLYNLSAKHVPALFFKTYLLVISVSLSIILFTFDSMCLLLSSLLSLSTSFEAVCVWGVACGIGGGAGTGVT